MGALLFVLEGTVQLINETIQKIQKLSKRPRALPALLAENFKDNPIVGQIMKEYPDFTQKNLQRIERQEHEKQLAQQRLEQQKLEYEQKQSSPATWNVVYPSQGKL